MEESKGQAKSMVQDAPSGGKQSEQSGVLQIALSGDIDHHRAVMLREWMDGLIRTRKPERLRLELSEITFMDSSGLGLIMGRYALLQRMGAEMVIVKPSAVAARMLQLAAMERFVHIEA